MKRLFLILASFALSLPALADIKLPDCFSDHMVLQRGMPIPVWGTAKPGEEVTVSFLGKDTSTTAGKDGAWKLNLPNAKAGGPHSLSIKNGPEFSDVLVGDVWLGSGQSNMAGSAGGYAKRDEVLQQIIDDAPYPTLRLLKRKGAWMEADSKNCAGFSAILLSFGVALQGEIKVPVGLRVGAVGGTPSGRWLTRDMLEGDPAAMAMLEASGKKHDWPAMQAKHKEAVAKWKVQAEKAKANKKRPPRAPRAPQEPGAIPAHVGNLYMPHISSFTGYGIRGVLWDQGESGTQIPGVDQYTTMGALVRGWRKAWGQDFPWLYVQKPSGGGPAWDRTRPENRMADKYVARGDMRVPGYNDYRIHHVNIDQQPKVALVQAVDLGSGVHPANKSGYGARAALVARGFAYDEDVVWSGPRYAGHKVKGGVMHVRFEQVGSGLAWKHGEKPFGFAIAGEDGVFHWAEAKIQGNDTVVLSSPKVESPKVAHYGMEKRRPYTNLFNKEGLPMAAFRTDWAPPKP